jgi:hypothetical protein
MLSMGFKFFQMEMETIPLPALPLISREHLSEEDHNYLVDKMVYAYLTPDFRKHISREL